MGPIELKGGLLYAGVAVGLVCIWFGYDLFRRAIVNPASGEFQAHGFRVKLQKAGPGIFFALMGVAIVIFCVTRDLRRDTVRRTIQPPIPAKADPGGGVIQEEHIAEAASADAGEVGEAEDASRSTVPVPPARTLEQRTTPEP